MHSLIQFVNPSVDLNRLCNAIDRAVVINGALRTRIVYCDGMGLLQVIMRKSPPILLSTETSIEQFLESDRSLNPGLGGALAGFALFGGVGEKKLVTTTHHALDDAVMAVKDCYQNASEGAAGKFAVQVLDERNSTSFKRAYVELLFNFSGRLQQAMRNESLLRLRSDSLSARQDNISSKAEQTRLLNVFATVNQDERLILKLEYNRHKAHQDRIAR